jgi:hypothetical protein
MSFTCGNKKTGLSKTIGVKETTQKAKQHLLILHFLIIFYAKKIGV